MEQKVYVAILGTGVGFRIRKGVLNTGTVNEVTYNQNWLRNKKTLVVPKYVVPFPYKRSRMYLVNEDKGEVVGLGSNIGIYDAGLKESVTMAANTRFLKFVGGRALDLIETLIYLGAGYGFFKMIEIVVLQLFK